MTHSSYPALVSPWSSMIFWATPGRTATVTIFRGTVFWPAVAPPRGFPGRASLTVPAGCPSLLRTSTTDTAWHRSSTAAPLFSSMSTGELASGFSTAMR